MSDKTIKDFEKLVKKALENREKTKLHKDMEFLENLFKNKEVSTKYKATKLADIYSVARTLNPKLNYDDLLKKKNLDKFKNWVKDEKIEQGLKDLLNTTKVGTVNVGSKKGNRIVSFLSKYAYYYTNKNFPIYDSMADEHLKTLHNKICENGKVSGKEQHEKHFNRYLTLIKHLKANGIEKFNGHTLIDGIDAFLWLYGIMDKATKDAENEVEKKFLYSSTCGPLNGFTKWYEDSKKFMQNNKQ